jgi:signal transduction histidine kinase
VKPDGKERWISCRGTPRYDDAGSPTHYSGLFLDITERKEAEKVLRGFEKLSAAARLSAALAHEINNPLSAVTNLIYLAKEAPDLPRTIAEQLALADQELERVAHAARQALGFYRESASGEWIDVPELIESVLKIFWPRIMERKIRIVRGFQKCGPAFGVRGEIRQVVSNLLANAIEAVSERGTISVGTQPAESDGARAIEIVVADDGHGIAHEHLDHIFEPFFTTKSGTGTGLGLWVAKEIVERHQGRIAVHPTDSRNGERGAAFTVTLPSGPGAPAAKTETETSASALKVEAELLSGSGDVTGADPAQG